MVLKLRLSHNNINTKEVLITITLLQCLETLTKLLLINKVKKTLLKEPLKLNKFIMEPNQLNNIHKQDMKIRRTKF